MEKSDYALTFLPGLSGPEIAQASLTPARHSAGAGDVSAWPVYLTIYRGGAFTRVLNKTLDQTEGHRSG